MYLYYPTVGTTKDLTYSGWWQVHSVGSSTTFTVLHTGAASGAASVFPTRCALATNLADVPVWLGTDGNYSALKTANTSSLSYEGLAAQRLAAAVNASMVMTDLTQSTTFVPWVTANAGGEYGLGEVVLRVPKASSTFLQATLGTVGANYDVYVNNIKRASSDAVSATALLHPSRVLISYPNYPELFDAPFAADSDSIVDINSADGEEITGLLPFFGDSAFGASQVESLLVVFKTNSIYLLDLNTRAPPQKIDSLGQGCTAPRSIAQTRNGIMFANLSGVYRLNRALTVSYVGKYVERYWRNTVNADQLSIATASNYALGRQYKLSVPIGSDSTNSVVLAYDYTRETPAYANVDEGFGAWTRYTNHAATGWCNLNSDAFFATSDGQVFVVRRALDSTDYRDDADAIDMTILVKSIDGGVPGVRKHCRTVVTHMRMETSVTGTKIYAATENSSTFALIGTVTKTLDDKKIVSFRSSLPTHRFVYLSLKYVNNVKDEAFILAGVDFLMAVLGTQGLVERSELS
jgi:hypothetical protein